MQRVQSPQALLIASRCQANTESRVESSRRQLNPFFFAALSTPSPALDQSTQLQSHQDHGDRRVWYETASAVKKPFAIRTQQKGLGLGREVCQVKLSTINAELSQSMLTRSGVSCEPHGSIIEARRIGCKKLRTDLACDIPWEHLEKIVLSTGVHRLQIPTM